MTSDSPTPPDHGSGQPHVLLVSNEPRCFPKQMPARRVGRVEQDHNSISETTKQAWLNNCVHSQSNQISGSSEDLRDLVYHGAAELRRQERILTDPPTFELCFRWLQIYQGVWRNAKNNDDIKLLALCWTSWRNQAHFARGAPQDLRVTASERRHHLHHEHP